MILGWSNSQRLLFLLQKIRRKLIKIIHVHNLLVQTALAVIIAEPHWESTRVSGLAPTDSPEESDCSLISTQTLPVWQLLGILGLHVEIVWVVACVDISAACVVLAVSELATSTCGICGTVYIYTACSSIYLILQKLISLHEQLISSWVKGPPIKWVLPCDTVICSNAEFAPLLLLLRRLLQHLRISSLLCPIPHTLSHNSTAHALTLQLALLFPMSSCVIQLSNCLQHLLLLTLLLSPLWILLLLVHEETFDLLMWLWSHVVIVVIGLAHLLLEFLYVVLDVLCTEPVNF